MNKELISELKSITNDLDDVGRARAASFVDEVAVTVLTAQTEGMETVAPTSTDEGAEEKPIGTIEEQIGKYMEQVEFLQRQLGLKKQEIRDDANQMTNEVDNTRPGATGQNAEPYQYQDKT